MIQHVCFFRELSNAFGRNTALGNFATKLCWVKTLVLHLPPLPQEPSALHGDSASQIATNQLLPRGHPWTILHYLL